MSQLRKFTLKEQLGMAFIVEASAISAFAVLVLLFYIGLKTLRSRSSGKKKRNEDSEHIHNYFISLMFAEVIQAIGGLMTAKWLEQAAIIEGPACTAQAIFTHMGNIGVAVTSLTIAIHTFCVLVFRWRAPKIVSYIVITLSWISIGSFIGIGYATHQSKEDPYYGAAGYWCWITENYKGQRIGLQYFWLWSCAIANIVIYMFLALVFWGFVAIDSDSRGIHFRRGRERREYCRQANDEDGKESRRIALRMLYYPLVYIISVSPQSIVRWLYFNNIEAPPGVAVFAAILFQLSGVFNVVLFTLTRPKIVTGETEKNDNGRVVPKILVSRVESWPEDGTTPQVTPVGKRSPNKPQNGLDYSKQRDGEIQDDESDYKFDDEREFSSKA